MRVLAGELRYDRARQEITRVATLLCVTATLFLFVEHPGPYPITMFLPPVGALFGYLVLRGPAGIPVSCAALLVGNAITLPREFAAAPVVELAGAVLMPVLLALAGYPLHRAWRLRTTSLSVFGVLTRFVLCGLLTAPLLVAGGTDGLSWVLGDPVPVLDLARLVLGSTASIVALAPAALVGAMLLTGQPPAVLRTSLAGRREALIPATVIVLAPVLALALPGSDPHELWLLPLAALPLIWISCTGDLIRSATVLAITALVVGTLARGLFGEGTALYRAQVMVLGCSLATLYVAAACITEAASRIHEDAVSTRWRALLAVAPAVVTRVAADGSWQAEGDGESALSVVSRTLPPAERQQVLSAIRERHSRTLRWQDGDPEQRHFITQVTPLPDGEALVVTTETTLADAAEAALAWERTHDRETGLPNRDLLLATAERALAAGTPASLLVIDLDQVSRRALLLGGDGTDGTNALRTLAQRIRAVFENPGPAGCLVARTGDDQLGVLLPMAGPLDPARGYRLLQAVRAPVDLPVGRVTVNGSIGLSGVEPPVSAAEALRRAAVAAQTARERGQAEIVVSDPLSLRTASDRARLISDVVAAVERSELEVVYQPDVDPDQGTLHGMEALVRWRRPDGLSVSTDDFVRMAEETGAVAAIDDWVMRASLAQLGDWRRELGISDVELGINVSVLSLTSDLPQRLGEECRRNDVPPSLIRLEVTETALGDDSRAIDVLRQARELGFRIALDDFGTGYASLSRLRTLPVDVIKLDRSFLASITEDAATRTLVGMILGLAEPLRLDVVVEGVETQAQRDVLVELGCQRAQGFLFSPPAGVAAIREILLDDRAVPVVPGGSASSAGPTRPVG